MTDTPMNHLAASDPAVASAIAGELARQRDTIELIASENFTSPAVLEAVGSVLTNKYAEGYPRRRYYGGCERVDVVEDLARQRACELFGCRFANVQPHSGANANLAAYAALVEPGDTILGMSLDQGGHLTHGSPVNFSGKLYRFVPYGLDLETEVIDYEALSPSFSVYIDRVVENAAALGDGLVEGGLRLVSGGTDNHLCLVDLTPADVTGKDAEHLLDEVGLTVNKNAIPGEPRSPFVTSGIRVGSAAGTTRGFSAEEFREIGGLIAQVVFHADDEAVGARVRARVEELLAAHPLYPELG